jgi:hypothetical protein
LVCDLEDLDFLHCETRRPREELSAIASFVAVIGNSDATTKIWTVPGITNDCSVLPFGLHLKFPGGKSVRIFQCEKKTLQTGIGLYMAIP